MKNALLNIELNNDNQGIAIYQQVADAILNKVKAGILKPGMMLPSTRKLAEQLQISRKTVVSAMDILQIKGIIVSKDRAGLVMDIATVLNSLNAKVRTLSARDSGSGNAITHVTLEVKNAAELKFIMSRIKNIQGVSQVMRNGS